MKTNGRVKNKVYVVILGVIIFASWLVFLVYPSEYQNNLVALKNTCADLTKSNSEGLVYEPVVGRYLGSKSRTSTSPAGQMPKTFSHKMVLKIRGGEEIELYVGDHQEQYTDFFKNLSQILGDMVVKKQKDTKMKFGICVSKNFQGIYFGKIETLTKIGVGK